MGQITVEKNVELHILLVYANNSKVFQCKHLKHICIKIKVIRTKKYNSIYINRDTIIHIYVTEYIYRLLISISYMCKYNILYMLERCKTFLKKYEKN